MEPVCGLCCFDLEKYSMLPIPIVISVVARAIQFQSDVLQGLACCVDEVVMLQFYLSQSKILSDHLRYVVEYCQVNGIPHTAFEKLQPERIAPGDAVVSCYSKVIEELEEKRSQVFKVLLPHNLTGLKGTPYSIVDADLCVISGKLILKNNGIDRNNRRFVIGGYAKWDTIFHERFNIGRRRQEIANDAGLDLTVPWIVFYPTAPNQLFRGNQRRAIPIYEKIRDDIGPCEFIFCLHYNICQSREAQQAVRKFQSYARVRRGVRCFDGSRALELITACDLFISDIASTMITAISMDKPVLFIKARYNFEAPRWRLENVADFQCGTFFGNVDNIGAFLDGYETPDALKNLLRCCIAYDDTQSCERIIEIILNRYQQWQDDRLDLSVEPS
ncbi:MAG: hypothetical protein C5S48_00050 [Candidatus Methanogaster sp.]|nr:MAG: hypothetical protein C5S48_00050 [ANME-2 cluster archaeon]